MAKTTREYVKYDTMLTKGINEANADGVVYDDGPDEPFVLQIRKVTHYDVMDGRGKNWRESSQHIDIVASLSIPQAGALVASLANDIAYAAEVGERRAITEERRHALGEAVISAGRRVRDWLNAYSSARGLDQERLHSMGAAGEIHELRRVDVETILGALDR